MSKSLPPMRSKKQWDSSRQLIPPQAPPKLGANVKLHSLNSAHRNRTKTLVDAYGTPAFKVVPPVKSRSPSPHKAANPATAAAAPAAAQADLAGGELSGTDSGGRAGTEPG